MNKKVYIQPQIWTVSTYAECSAPLTGSTGTEYLNGQKPGGSSDIQNGGEGGAEELSKEHFNDFDSWDSWD
nr:hypothetical protein [Prevotella sp.]